MMEVYKTPSKEIQDIVFANVTYEAVINGLNGYFASEPRNDYITVKMEFDDIKQDFALYEAEFYEAEAWADILITWLRTEHGIFYYPGMEAKYAKSERIPPLTERLMDEGALNSLKRLHKRVTGKEPEVISHTLIADGISHAVTVKETQIEELKKHITLLEADLKKRTAEIKEVNDKRWKDLRDINKVLGYDCMDGRIDDFAIAVKARAECVKRALGEESDINALIRDYCTKNDIIAPSRYFSDKACVEYLFSVVDLKQKNRAAVILQDLYRDIFKKQPNGLSAEDIANKILDKVLETEDLLHKSVDSVNKECKATGKLMIADYKLKLKDYILKDIKEHGYRYGGLEKKSIEEIVDWIVTMATCPRNEWAKDEIENLRGQISRLKDLINVMNEEVKDM